MVLSILKTSSESNERHLDIHNDYTLLIIELTSRQGRSAEYRSGETKKIYCTIFCMQEKMGGNTITYPGEWSRLT